MKKLRKRSNSENVSPSKHNMSLRESPCSSDLGSNVNNLECTVIKYANGDTYDGHITRLTGGDTSTSPISSMKPRSTKAGALGSASQSHRDERVFRHGVGTYFYKNGDKYCGNWRKSRMHGKGSFYWVCASELVYCFE